MELREVDTLTALRSIVDLTTVGMSEEVAGPIRFYLFSPIAMTNYLLTG